MAEEDSSFCLLTNGTSNSLFPRLSLNRLSNPPSIFSSKSFASVKWRTNGRSCLSKTTLCICSALLLYWCDQAAGYTGFGEWSGLGIGRRRRVCVGKWRRNSIYKYVTRGIAWISIFRYNISLEAVFGDGKKHFTSIWSLPFKETRSWSNLPTEELLQLSLRVSLREHPLSRDSLKTMK